ncbi:DMT family transporter [Sediminitomix flava]|uniref:EamA-like transporter family protein n=1 Tax=Sediminitomix flava TaxID=379075 RepID=A0A315ZSS1_SEDFL|nr:DMT family transporter [Sediminitomix flava]PWJ37900.1 EamA-like transporter family protein [Sediminitomix flava]
MWVLLSIFSAAGLGVYDVLKKVSLNNNAVLPVLLFSSLAASIVVLPFIVLSFTNPQLVETTGIFIPFSGWNVQFLIMLKTVLVLGSWICAFFAIKHLPLTIVTPIRATGPLWTLIGAIFIYHEVPSALQLFGIGITLVAFYYFSIVGKVEGIDFKTNKWIGLIIVATLLGACSGLYDKYLCRIYDPKEIQAYFTIYQLLFLLPLNLLLWYPKKDQYSPFQWRWSIPAIGLTLLFSDFLYFKALSDPDALISVVSTARRGSVVIAFFGGFLLYKEKNLFRKLIALSGIMLGIMLLYIGS